MKCPRCSSSNIRKDDHYQNKQKWECFDFGRIFRSAYETRGYHPYHPQVREACLKKYLNSLGFRTIKRVTGVHHTTIMNWVKQSAEELPEDWQPIAELDEIQTYVGRRSHKVWIWTAVNHYVPSILAIEIGDRSGQTFEKLWKRIKTWVSRRYLTDGYCVYANYIELEKHVILPKIKLVRVEGENTILRNYLARLHQYTLCYSKSKTMLRYSIRLLMHYLSFKVIPLTV